MARNGKGEKDVKEKRREMVKQYKNERENMKGLDKVKRRGGCFDGLRFKGTKRKATKREGSTAHVKRHVSMEKEGIIRAKKRGSVGEMIGI